MTAPDGPGGHGRKYWTHEIHVLASECREPALLARRPVPPVARLPSALPPDQGCPWL